MKVLKESNITSFDCDGTLVLWSKKYHEPKTGTIEFWYGNEKIYLYPHIPHVTFLKHCYNRGDFIEIWSQNGWEWAKQVIEKLELTEYVHLVRSKPSRHIDDKQTLEDIVGNRIFLKYNPED